MDVLIDKHIKDFFDKFIEVFENLNGRKINDTTKQTDKKKIDGFVKHILRDYETRFSKYVLSYNFDFKTFGISNVVLGMDLNEKAIAYDLKHNQKKKVMIQHQSLVLVLIWKKNGEMCYHS